MHSMLDQVSFLLDAFELYTTHLNATIGTYDMYKKALVDGHV